MTYFDQDDKELELQTEPIELEAAPNEYAQEIIKALEEKIIGLEKDRLMTLADTENRCRRIETHSKEREQFAVTSFAKEILTISDSLDSALKSRVTETESPFLTGIQMTSVLLHNVLEKFGITRVDALHHLFNPEFHQAVQEIPNSEYPKNVVIQVLQEGYMLHNRVLRAAMVVVSCGPVKEVVNGSINLETAHEN
jgi:molecular chaperone GrpE